MNKDNYSNNSGGFNLSNLFDLNKLFGSGRNSQNPLTALSRMFGGGSNYKRQSRNIVKLLPIEEAYRLIKSGNCFLLDVRTEMEYNTIRIKGSVNIPLSDIKQKIEKIHQKKNANKKRRKNENKRKNTNRHMSSNVSSYRCNIQQYNVHHKPFQNVSKKG